MLLIAMKICIDRWIIDSVSWTFRIVESWIGLRWGYVGIKMYHFIFKCGFESIELIMHRSEMGYDIENEFIEYLFSKLAYHLLLCFRFANQIGHFDRCHPFNDICQQQSIATIHFQICNASFRFNSFQIMIGPVSVQL